MCYQVRSTSTETRLLSSDLEGWHVMCLLSACISLSGLIGFSGEVLLLATCCQLRGLNPMHNQQVIYKAPKWRHLSFYAALFSLGAVFELRRCRRIKTRSARTMVTRSTSCKKGLATASARGLGVVDGSCVAGSSGATDSCSSSSSPTRNASAKLDLGC
jgi:hypothetical protein